MKRSLPFNLGNQGGALGKKSVVLALSRVEVELEQISDRHTRLLKRVKKREKIVAEMLEQLSQRHSATLRHLAEREDEIDAKLAKLSKKQAEILKKIG
jgi:hypothetical protein